MILHNGYLQYGPYAAVAEGTNRIKIVGSGFDKLTEDSMYINIAGVVPEKNNVTITPEKVTYYAVFNEAVSGVEFCLKNDSADGGEIVISSLQIYHEKINFPDVLKDWWK